MTVCNAPVEAPVAPLSRRRFLSAAAALPMCGAGAFHAQSGTNLRMLVGFPPGGASDVVARALSEQLNGNYASTVIVDNKPGAGGRIAVESLKRAAPDGQTALLAPLATFTLYPHVYKDLRFDPWIDVTPVSAVSHSLIAVFAGPGLPTEVRTLAELQAWALKNPTRTNFGVPGLGSSPHLTGLVFSKLTGTPWHAIGYQGAAPGIVALLSGETPVYYGTIAEGLEHVRSGKLRALATSGAQRSAHLPEVPTFAEQKFGALVYEEFHSVFLPGHAPTAALERLAAAVRAAVGTRAVADTLTRLALDSVGNTPQELLSIQRAQSDRWAAIVKSISYTPE